MRASLLGTVWHWIQRNAGAITAVSSAVVAIALIATLPPWVYEQVRPELLVIVEHREGTLPREINQWLRAGAFRIKGYSALLEKLTKAVDVAVPGTVSNNAQQTNAEKKQKDQKTFASLKEWLSKPGAAMLDRRLFFSEFQTIEITIHNRSDRTIRGVRMRVDDPLLEIVAMEASGTFVTPHELQDFRERVGELSFGALNLPELPPLPPNSELKLALYGGHVSRFALVKISADNACAEVVKMTKVEDRWPLWLCQHAWLSLWVAVLLGAVLGSVAVLVFLQMRKRRVHVQPSVTDSPSASPN